LSDDRFGKLARMRESIQTMGSALVAYSGGVDSAFLLKVTLDTLGPDRVLAVTATSESLVIEELDEACALAQRLGATHEVIKTSELQSEDYASNPINRCYYCKGELFRDLAGMAAKRGFNVVLDGANHDDLSDHRPGHAAATELGARSPLQEVGLTKAEIRDFSRELGLPTWDKPSAPCLSSRVPYGQRITAEKLRQIGDAERVLHRLGYREVRVRHHDTVARIELPVSQLVQFVASDQVSQVVSALKALGFRYVTLDLQGFRSGSLNEALQLPMVGAAR
jgi:pyridinium-3,5-biscarboxylic acid mononucleotide sulfurtransferase